MKIKNLFLLLVLVPVLIVTGFSSCEKSDDPQSDFPINTLAYVSVVHASPRTGSIDIALDKNRLNLNFFNYSDRVAYFNAYTGSRTFYAYKKGSNDTLVAKNILLLPQKNYTIFIVDTMNKIDAVLVRDSSRAPGADSVRIRFANMSPDAGNLDLYLKGNNTPIASNVPYKTASEFISLKAANTVELEVRETGKGSVLEKTQTVNLVNGNYYTVWASGFQSSTALESRPRVDVFWH